ncbi:MAG: hypothetical protein Q4F27_03850 [Desulfovibrionaceae bacterium]|nr:hypothetical protein [Desulfovibrionaceae bacterium]
MSATKGIFVKPWKGLRSVFNRAQEQGGIALPRREFCHFLTAWNAFQAAVARQGQARPPVELALACVEALAPLDPAPCTVLRDKLATWRPQDACSPWANTCLPGEPGFYVGQCSTPHDVAAFCHARAVEHMLTLAGEQKGSGVRQLWDGVPKQFWAVDLGDGFADDPGGRIIGVGQIASRPMRALWHGMNILPWQGPPAVNGRGFLSVLFEATANPQLDPAFGKALFFEKNHFLLSSDYCHMHSRFGFHTVEVEARLGARPQENHLQFQLRGGAANLERRILRARFIARLLAPFGFSAQLCHDAVCARLGGISMEEGERLAAVMGYVTIHTRQLDMIMQDAAQVADRYATMQAHCRALYAGQALPPADA